MNFGGRLVREENIHHALICPMGIGMGQCKTLFAMAESKKGLPRSMTEVHILPHKIPLHDHAANPLLDIFQKFFWICPCRLKWGVLGDLHERASILRRELTGTPNASSLSITPSTISPFVVSLLTSF
jgi:hypothetical protein